MFLYVPSIW